MKKMTVEAVDLQGVDVLEQGIAPALAVMSTDSPAPQPGPTEPDTLPG